MPYAISPLAKFPDVKCLLPTNEKINSINGDTGNPFIQNCEFYMALFASGTNQFNYGCVKCKFGFNGPVDNGGYLKSCSQMNDTDKGCQDVRYYGLDLMWEFLLTCHQCKNDRYLPFIMMRGTGSTKPTPRFFAEYNLDSLEWKATGDINRRNIECLEPVKSSFGYANDDNKFQLPQNCGLGFVNLQYTDGDSTNNSTANNDEEIEKLAIYCGACKPMFKATQMSSTYPFIQVGCTPIEFCQDSTWFNNCSVCLTGYVFEWTDTLINYDNCIPNSIQNCFAARVNGEETICMACQTGYNLNQDFFCEQLNPPNCISSTEFVLKGNYFAHPFYSYYHGQRGLGCSQCESGFSAVEVSSLSKNSFICTSSSYLRSHGETLSTDSNFIARCQFYTIESNLLQCAKCSAGFLLLEENNKKKCVVGLENCELLENRENCKKCATGFSLVSFSCEKGIISNCQAFNEEDNNSEQKCLQCNAEYYLTVENTCLAGKVRDCTRLVDNNAGKCLQCDVGFVLIQKASADYCYPIAPELNCSTAQITQNTKYGASISCQTCSKPNQFLVSDPNLIPIQTSCLLFTEIPNCKTYNTTTQLSSTKYSCKECQADYFNDKAIGQCKARQYSSSNCLKFDFEKDKCLECSLTTILTTLGECEPLPSGVTGCRNYSSATICVACQKNRYLQNNLCPQVSDLVLIDKCLYYVGNGNCEKCEDNYFLKNNECLLASAQSCLTYKDIDTCESCPKNYGLVLDSKGTLNCQPINKPNCLTFEQSGNFPCLQCSNNYYVDSNGECQAVTVPIPNCELYESNTKCRKCNKDTALSTDQMTCDNILSITSDFDSNCNSAKNRYKCSTCQPGAFFEGEQCVLCAQPEECFVCEPDEPSTCLLCNTGYFMDSAGKCNRNIPSALTDTDLESNSRIFKVLMVILGLTLF